MLRILNTLVMRHYYDRLKKKAPSINSGAAIFAGPTPRACVCVDVGALLQEKLMGEHRVSDILVNSGTPADMEVPCNE